jgi:CRP-like cAMP-binding protein
MAGSSKIFRKSTWLDTEFNFMENSFLFFSIGFEGDVTLLDDKVHLHRLPDRYTLTKEGEQLNKLFFVIHGSIVGLMKEITGAKKERRNLIFKIK